MVHRSLFSVNISNIKKHMKNYQKNTVSFIGGEYTVGLASPQTMRQKLHVSLNLRMKVKVLKISHIVTNLSASAPVNIPLGLLSNRKYFSIFANLFNGISFVENENFVTIITG